jgi:hypothetical protein
MIPKRLKFVSGVTRRYVDSMCVCLGGVLIVCVCV